MSNSCTPGGSYGMLALLAAPAGLGPSSSPRPARPRQLPAILIMMPQRAAEAPTLGCRISRGCQVQPEHAATKHAVTPHVYCQ